jgi:hypothetical protein
MPRHGQVDHVGILQVDLGRTAGAFEDDDVVARRQPIVGVAYMAPQRPLEITPVGGVMWP